MNNNKLTPETKEYIDLFYEPKVSAYKFLKVFFAVLYENGIRDISRDLVAFFSGIKQEEKYGEIMHEIKFRSNGIFQYSDELEDNIFMLQNMGLLGKENPSFGVILIKYSDEITKKILAEVPPEQLSLIKEIADRYTVENSSCK